MSTVIPDLFDRIVDANGAPVAGAKMYWYLAGTSTPTTVYQDSATTVPHAQPIVADTGGLLPVIYAKDGSYKVVLQDSLGNTLYTLDNYSIVTAGGGGTLVSAPVVLKTANYVVQSTDRNNVFTVDASGAAGQNVVITADSATLTNGFPFAVIDIGTAGTVTIVGVGAQTVNGLPSFTLTAQNQAIQLVSSGAAGWVISGSTAGSFINAVTFLAGAQFNSSVAFKEQTLVITSNIAAWDMSAGPDAYVTAALAFTMALPTKIPTGGRGHLRMNNSTAAPFIVTFNGVFAALYGGLPVNLLPGTTYYDWEENGGVVYISYRPAGAPVLLNTLTASNVASLSDTTSFTSAYRYYEIVLENVVPATNNVFLQFRPQVSGTFQSTVSAANLESNSVSAVAFLGASGEISRNIANTAGGGVSGKILIENPASASVTKIVNSEMGCLSGGFAGKNSASLIYSGSTAAMTGFQLIMSAGNISTGTVRIYGSN